MKDPLAELETVGVGSVAVDLSDESGAPLGRLDLNSRATVGEIAANAPTFGLPDDEYAIYRVTAGPDGKEAVERIPPSARLDDIETPKGDCLYLRYAPALKGAR